MKYSDIRNVLPNANHVYAGVSDEQVEALTVEHYLTKIGDEILLGTMEPVAELSELEL